MDDYNLRAQRRLETKKLTDDGSTCWHFDGALAGNGYGHISYRGRSEYAHRVSAILFLNFEPAPGRFVLHTCDMPDCFNPEHLVIGTQAENMRDAAAKGRMRPNKLGQEQVEHIKYRLGRGDTYRTLATEYSVSTTTIGQIARGDTWKDVAPKPPPSLE